MLFDHSDTRGRHVQSDTVASASFMHVTLYPRTAGLL